MEEVREKAGEVVAGGEDVLRQQNEALNRELKSREATVLKLELALTGKDGEVAALRQSFDEAKRQLDEIGQALPRAVAAYKTLVVQANPGVLAELVDGDSIEAVNESLKNARLLVGRVRQDMEAEASQTRVPAGAPPRALPDLAGLSSREKIKYAIGGSPS